MCIKIFKFGGAAISNASGFRNVASILRQYDPGKLLLIVSAMGKTTNALEGLLTHYLKNDPLAVVESFRLVREAHFSIIEELFPDKDHAVYGEVDSLFNQLRGYIRKGHLYSKEHRPYDYEYDQIVSYGELFSSAILSNYLVLEGFPCTLFDVRALVATDATYRDARVDWKETGPRIQKTIRSYFNDQPLPGSIALTQGFIGAGPDGETTTLGREGSDFTAAIFGRCLQAEEITIWKDVPGVMNADPKWMDDAVCLETLSYRETIELAYYGATVIHPKTIKPLENAGITLRVRSFVDPSLPGTLVKKLRKWKISTPVYIRKQEQMLISLSPRDFSFVVEENLSEIFRALARSRVKVNVMHNSAISFSVCVDADLQKVDPLIRNLKKDYEIRYNTGLELYTVRHYDDNAISRIVNGRKIIMEIRSRNMVQLVVK